MGSHSSSSTVSGNFHDTQNINNYNNYSEKHNKTYNNNEEHTTNRNGDVTNGNVRNLQGMSNAGNQCFGAGCLLNLQGLAPIEQRILMNLQAERASNPAAYVNHLAQLL